MPVTVIVGPSAVRAPRDSRIDDVVTAALDGVDDDFVLLDGQPVAVDSLWGEVFRALLDDEAATLICPSRWSEHRIAAVSAAAHSVVARVEVSRRSAALASVVTRPPGAVVEIAADAIAVSRPPIDRPTRIVAREEDPTHVADEVARFAGTGCVVIDRPDGTPGADVLSTLIADRLRAGGSTVTVVDDTWLLRAVQAPAADERVEPAGAGRPRRIWPWVGAAVAAGVAVAGIVTGAGRPAATRPTLLVEGRVVVEVPATWTARRITAGPGSARVEVDSPSDPHAAVHVTQSLVPRGETLAQTAETLRRAMLDEPPGVFVDFNATGRSGTRSSVTYREIRDGHDIRWVVLLDGLVRISIGCQSARGGEEAVRDACERAVRSAREVGEIAGTVEPHRQSNNT